MTDESKRTKKSDNAEEPIKLEIQPKGPPSRTDSAARLTPGVRSESTDSARPISTTSKGDAISEGATSSTARRRKKEKALPPGAHRVNLTVHISLAIPAAELDNVPAEAGAKETGDKKKKRVLEAPKALSHFHCEYQFLPDDKDPVKVDIVTYGMAAKIYTEGMEARVVKTWNNAGLTWVAWTHNINPIITEDALRKLVSHKIVLRIWDVKEKMSQRARFDRPKAFRLPQPKPGEDPDTVGGVKHLVLKQARYFDENQPKRSYINRPLPLSRPSTTTDRSEAHSPGKRQHSPSGISSKPSGTPTSPSAKKTVKISSKLVDANKNIKMYNKLNKLAETETPNLGTKSVADMQPPNQIEYAGPSQNRAHSKQKNFELDDGSQVVVNTGKPQAAAALQPPQSVESEVSIATKKKRRQKAEAAVQAQLEHAKKFGICTIETRAAEFIAGTEMITSRLDKPVAGVEDILITMSTNGPLMTAEQTRNLNPLVIKVHGATNMPRTPMSFEELRFRCQPAYIKYKLMKDDVTDHLSVGREQDSEIYWNDINVLLAGTMDSALLHQYLSGPPLSIEVHDRDRILEKQKLKPTLFGDDLEDEKISNVGTVSSKRTIHNPYATNHKPWDPYGIARFDLSSLLLGQKTVYMSAPIHGCLPPDILGTRSEHGGKLYGVSGAVDGPQDAPLASGHYIESHSVVKISIHLAHPLVTPVQLAEGRQLQSSEQSAFGRIIFKFAYRNVKFLNRLQNLLTQINSTSLELQDLPADVIPTALSTYKLSVDQQKNPTLDIVTGFQIMDGKRHIFVLEGLQDGAIQRLWSELPKPHNTDVEVLYNSDFMFSGRLYGPLEVDICRIKLHEELDLIVQQPLLYVRDMVPKLCFEALTKLKQMVECEKLRDAVRNDVFPTAEMIISMSKEFGVPLTEEDYEDLRDEEESVLADDFDFPISKTKTSRQWTPMDNYNPEYIQQLQVQKVQGTKSDYERGNKEHVASMSAKNGFERSRTMPVFVYQNNATHNYSTQTLNSTEQAHEKLRQVMSATDPDLRFTYNPAYHHSMTLLPDNINAVKKAIEDKSKEEWKTPKGWSFPGKKTMAESNIHPSKPDTARTEHLTTPWEENTLHSNFLKPTLIKRERYDWSNRQYDMDIWTKPDALEIPLTIHQAGDTLKAEKDTSKAEDRQEWKSKIVVENPEMKFHRCATETELLKRGFKSSNQIEKLKSMLKDEPKKIALQNPGVCLTGIPPLNVVLNPSVDTAARQAGCPLPVLQTAKKEHTNGFQPGPYKERTWLHEDNRVPRYNYHHEKYNHDFNVYHKERQHLHKRHINPLSDEEYNTHLFRWRSAPDAHRMYKYGFAVPSYDEIHQYNEQTAMSHRLDVPV